MPDTRVPPKKRGYIACRNCRRRKVKCITDEYEGKPCQKCIREGLKCEYVSVEQEQSASLRTPPSGSPFLSTRWLELLIIRECIRILSLLPDTATKILDIIPILGRKISTRLRIHDQINAFAHRDRATAEDTEDNYFPTQ
ncbi:hypothetical protein B0H13DRAFT_1873282 [Mycena leptocephala]|nr:hypothetical protein B0H13DRAFT_1873282 [Mycena leptocephala]